MTDRTFPPPGHYWRPNLHLNTWFFMPPEVKSATWWTVAWTATTVLWGIRVYQAFTTPDDEIGD